MAFVSKPAIKITYTVRDQSRISYASFHIGKNGADYPNVNDPAFIAFCNEFAASLQNVSDCFVSGYNITLDYENDAVPTFGPAADVERKGVLQFKTADGFYTLFTIPGAKYDMFDPQDGETIIRPSASADNFDGNPLETHLESIHDKLVNGATIALETFPATDRRGGNINRLWDGYKQHRSNPRG